MIKFFPFAAAPLPPTQPIAGVIGNFDGFHLGHQMVIGELLKTANEKNLQPWLITFAPHPRLFFNENLDNFLLTTQTEKIALAKHYKLAGVAVIDFNKDLANLSAVDFVKKILIDQLAVKTLLVGKDFRFGKGRAGDVAALRDHGINNVVALDLANIDGGVVSSSAIREKITAGDMAAANKMLGRPFNLSEKIVHGDRQGRTIGFSTANLDVAQLRADKKILPRDGIYAVTATIAGDNRIYLGSCYHGVRAGLDKKMAERLETYLFDFTGDCYDKTMTIYLRDYIRGDKKIDNMANLQKQIAEDNNAVRAVAKKLRLLN
ncbi:MAG: riboflavin biosynthesis protein RibF [Hydrotalea sp.]|nr:riboflavin biosynthesis protein RibF [Hydrotalea sp.]